MKYEYFSELDPIATEEGRNCMRALLSALGEPITAVKDFGIAVILRTLFVLRKDGMVYEVKGDELLGYDPNEN